MIRWEAPLRWPDGKLRKARPRASSFAPRTIAVAGASLVAELNRFGVYNGTITAQGLRIRKNGDLLADQIKTRSDHGVAVWFKRYGVDQVIAADEYNALACNIWALAQTIDAFRRIERHGGAGLIDQTMSAFQALPAPGTKIVPAGTWWADVLGLQPYNCFVEDIEAAFREKAKTAHPDAGGSPEEFQRLVDAKAAALEGKR